jgi:hypothetical protein
MHRVRFKDRERGAYVTARFAENGLRRLFRLALLEMAGFILRISAATELVRALRVRLRYIADILGEEMGCFLFQLLPQRMRFTYASMDPSAGIIIIIRTNEPLK